MSLKYEPASEPLEDGADGGGAFEGGMFARSASDGCLSHTKCF